MRPARSPTQHATWGRVVPLVVVIAWAGGASSQALAAPRPADDPVVVGTPLERAKRRAADHLQGVLVQRGRLVSESPARAPDHYLIGGDTIRLLGALALRAVDRELTAAGRTAVAEAIGTVAASDGFETYAVALALLLADGDAALAMHLPALRARLLRARVRGGLWGAEVRGGQGRIEHLGATSWALLALQRTTPAALPDVVPAIRQRLLSLQGTTGAWRRSGLPLGSSVDALRQHRRLRTGPDEGTWLTLACSAVLVAAEEPPAWPAGLRVPLRRLGARAVRELDDPGGAPISLFVQQRWTYDGLLALAVASEAAGRPRAAWFDPVAARLLALQRPDGGWGPVGEDAAAASDPAATGFALLFLAGVERFLALPPPPSVAR